MIILPLLNFNMITIPEVVEQIIRRSPFLEEGMYQGIINYSALARIIKLEIEKETMKDVTEGAIIMALKRLSSLLKHKQLLRKIFKNHPDIILRSNLVEFTIMNSDFILEKYKKLLEKIEKQKKYFLIITQGVFETTIIISRDLKETANILFKEEKRVSHFDDLSAITIRLPEEVIPAPGVYYHILKSLAWEGINLIEVASTYTEFTLIMKEKYVDRAFTILKNQLSTV